MNNNLRPKSLRLTLEERIVFDAALPIVAVDFVDPESNEAFELNPDTETPNTPDSAAAPSIDTIASLFNEQPAIESDSAERTLIEGTLAPTDLSASEIIFIDATVVDLEQYLLDRPNADVVLLDAKSDGMAQIAAVLEHRNNIESIHILSHGSAGNLVLGNAVFNEKSMLDKHADALETINNALTDDGDILIYGCNFAEGERGLSAVNTLAVLTSADIAASDNATGAASLGGDWQLERSKGAIESATIESEALVSDWHDLLATQVVNETSLTSGSYTMTNNGQVTIAIKGGDGGYGDNNANAGGAGANVTGTFNVTAGQVIRYVVGEASADNSDSAGGGGSTGVYIDNQLVLVAGGGGGGDDSPNEIGLGANTSTNGDSGIGSSAGAGGIGGNGGGGIRAGGGGGINSAGGNGYPGAGGQRSDTTTSNPSILLDIQSGGVGDRGGAGGRGFTSGGGAEDDYAGGGGGYSGGGSAGSSGRAGGGGSYIHTSAISSSATAGGDGASTRSHGYITVTITASAPVNSTPASVSVNEDIPFAFTGGNQISVADAENNLARTQLSVNNGRLFVTLSGSASISAGVNGTSSLTIDGTQAQINATLASLTYTGNPNFNGTDTLTVLSTDATSGTPLSDSDTVIITVNPVADAPGDLLTTVTTEGGLSINADGGNNLYLQADTSPFSGNGQVTVEVDFQVTSPAAGMTTLLSYATATTQDELYVGIDAGGEVFFRTSSNSGPGYGSTTHAPQLLDGNRHTLTVTWENTGGILIFYVDGEQLGLGRNDYQKTTTIDASGNLVFGQHHTSPGSGFVASDTFEGTIYNARIFSDLRSAGEIAASYRSDLPYDEAGMLAQWSFDNLSSDSIVTETVSGNNLTVKHVTEPGFTASEALLTFSLNENALDGTVVGQVSGVDAEREAKIASLLAADSTVRYSAETGKFYRFYNVGVQWATAQGSAQLSTLNGVNGQLVEIRSAMENQFVVDLINAHGATQAYIGASDSTLEGEWRWGGASGDLFWQGNGSGFAVDGAYSNWDGANPDDSGGNQDYAKIFASTGLWDDVDGTVNQRFIAEYDADAVLDATNALTYSITSQTVAGAFSINSDNGEITVADGSLLDYETNATHTVTVRVSDGTATYDEAFTISLNDLVEANNAPTDLSSGIELNTDGGNDAYLQASNGDAILGGLSQLTFETRFQIENGAQPTFASYASAGQANEFNLYVNTGGNVAFHVNGSFVATSLSLTDFNDGDIHSLAFSWDNTAGAWSIYLDGQLTDSGTGHAVGATLDAGGTFILGQEQDSQGGSFESTEAFQGTLYDVRIWNEVRSEAEIALNYQNKFDSGSLPSGLVANWQMDGFNGSNQVVDVVSGNNLSIGHATGTGYTASTPVEDLHISENAVDGTSVGFVVPSDPDVNNDIVSDGLFAEATPSTTQYGLTGTFGNWTVTQASVDMFSTSDWESPLGGRVVNLDGSAPGAIEQTLTTVAGRQYQVIFALTGDFSGGEAVKNLRVSASGTSADYQATQSSNWLWGETGSFERRSFNFTADDITSVLQFRSLEGPTSTYGPYIADVQVIEIPAAVTAILNNDPSLSYDAATGKFYKAVNSGVTFSTAVGNATSALLNGFGGQLVTINSDYENELVRGLVQGFSDNVWIGATDATTEGSWHWLDGSNESQLFWTGTSGGTLAADAYANWNGIEPNNSGGNEDAAELSLSTGLWNDANATGTNTYVIEWDASEVLSNFTFSLTDDAGGRFGIDSNTGQVTVADGSLLDYETANAHNVTVQVTDAAGNTYSEVMSIAVDNALDANQTVPGPQSVNEDAVLTFNVANGNAVSVSDSMAGTNSPMQVTLSVNNGVLNLSGTAGITFVEGTNGGGSFVINGTESDINAVLEGMTFTPDANFNGSVTLNMTTALTVDLVGHYTFEGGNADDRAAGIADNGSLTGGAATMIDPERGEVLSLDGTGGYVDIVGMYGNPPNATLAAWVKLENVAGIAGNVISLGDNLAISVDRVSNNWGVQGFYRHATEWNHTNSGQFIAGAGWHHIAYTVDDASNIQRLFIDGQLVAETNFSESIAYSLQNFTRIGGNPNGDSIWDFDGLIDDARIYTRPLSADEIAALASNQTEVNGTVAITVNAVNDAPVVTSPGSAYSFTEQGSLNIHGTGFSLADVDDNGGTFTATFSVGEGRVLIDAGDSGVTLTSGAFNTSGNSTDTVTFTGTKAQINALLSGSSTGTIVYYHDQTASSDVPSASTTITLTVNDQGNAGSDPGLTGDGSSEEHSASQTINITSVNDSPEFLGPNLLTNGTFDSDLSGWTTTGTVTHSISRVSFGSGGNAGPHTLSQTIATNIGDVYTLEFDYRDNHANLNQQLQVTVDGSSNVLTTQQILTDRDDGSWVRYRFEFTADSTSSTLTFTDTSDDVGSLSAATNGVDSAMDNISVRQVNGQLGTASFTEGGSPVVLDSDVTLFDAEIDAALDDFNGTTLTLARNGGVSGDDVFSASGLLSALTEGGNLVYNSLTVGSVTTNSGGMLVLTFNSAADNTAINNVMQSIGYSNSSNTPPTNVQIDWTFNDNNDSSQGSGGSANANGYTTVSITGTNNLPIIDNVNGDTLAYNEGDGQQAIDQSADALVSDIDSSDFDTGTLTVSFTAGSDSAKDVLSIIHTGIGVGEIGVSGGNVSYEGAVIGSFTGGTGGTDLVITLNANADTAAVSALTQQISYENTDNDNPTVGNRTVRFVLTDGDGGTSANYDTTISVAGVNDAPEGADNTVTTAEDTDYTFARGDFGFTDVDSTMQGVRIASLPSLGTLFLDANEDGIVDSGEVINVGDIINEGNIDAGRLKFRPAADDNGSPYTSFTFQVRDGDGTANGGVNLDPTPNTMTVNITGVNDAPALDNSGTPLLPTITEDETSNSGMTVANLLTTGAASNPISDAEGDPEGIAIVNSNNGRGIWEYSTDGGTNWSSFGTVSETQALLLRATDLVRFAPDGQNGTITDRDFEFRAWDQSTGTAGDKVDTSVNGGATAFSSVTEIATITTTDVNDAPDLDNSANLSLTSQAEDAGMPVGAVGTVITDLVSTGGNVTDVDASSQTGIAIKAADTTNGTWWYTTNSGTNWNSLGNVSDSSARVLNASSGTRVYFQSDSDFNGTISDAITFRAWDRSLGSNGSLQDASTNGGTSAFSSATETADITITAVNDAPQLLGPSIVANGDFSTGDLSGWTTTGNVDNDGIQARFGQIGGANGTLSQTLTTEVGRTYVLSFDYRDGSTTNSQSLQVDVLGGSTLLDAAVDTGVLENTAQTYQYTFIADSISTTITFTDTSTDHSGVRGYLDNITVATDAVPNANLNYTENDGAVVVDPTIEIEDIDDSDIETAVVAISANYVNGEDVLTFVDQNGISGSWNATSGELSLTGSATLADYQTALRSITYENTSDNPSIATRTVSFTVNDGDVDSNTQTRDIDLTAVNDAAVQASIEGTALDYTENDGAIAITSTITFTDVDDTNIESAVVQISGNYAGAQDVLAFTNQNGITGHLVGNTLTLTGSATLAQYETAIRSITYTNSSENPNTAKRTVSFTVNDGEVNSNTLTRDIDITAINDEEVLASNTGTSVAEGSTGNIITTVMLHTTDVDNTGAQLIYTVDVVTNNGTLRLNGTALGLNDTFTQADIDAGNVTYDHNDSQTSSDSFDFTVDDGSGLTSSSTFNFTITPVPDAPVNTLPTSISVNEATTFAFTGSNQISVADVDGDLNSTQLTVGNGKLSVTLSGLASISAGVNGSSSLTITGTEVDINATLASLTYTGSPNFNGTDTLTVLSSDATSGTPLTDTDTVSITVNGIPEQFTVSIPEGPIINSEEASSDDGVPVVINLPIDAVAGDVITLTIDGSAPISYIVTSIDIANNVASVLLPSNDISATGQGSAVITTTYTNAVGNSAPPVITNVTIDTIAPATTVNPVGDTVKTAAAATNSAGIITINGEAGTTSVMTLTGQTGAINKSITNNGTSLPVVLTDSDLAILGDGLVEVSVVTTDTAGNETIAPDLADGDFMLDTTAPAAPIASLDPSSDAGIKGDHLTNDNTPTISGIGGTPGDVINLFDINRNILGTTIVGENGTWSITPTSPQPNGINTFTMTASDPVGNVSTEAAIVITIDTVAPDVNQAPDITDETDTEVNDDNITSNTRPSFEIPAIAADERPILYIDGLIINAVYDADANTLTPVNPLMIGQYHVSYRIEDAAGNLSDNSPALAFEVRNSNDVLFEQLVSEPENNGFNNTVDKNTHYNNDLHENRVSKIANTLSLSPIKLPALPTSPLTVAESVGEAVKDKEIMNDALKGGQIGMDPAIYVQNAVRGLELALPNDAYVQTAVAQSQVKSNVRNDNVNNFNSANPIVSDLLDPFSLNPTAGMSETTMNDNGSALKANQTITEPVTFKSMTEKVLASMPSINETEVTNQALYLKEKALDQGKVADISQPFNKQKESDMTESLNISEITKP